jgi:hypothetical protein
MHNLNFELATTLEHLELAQWHVASGSRLIRRQREILLHLERDGEPVVALSATAGRLRMTQHGQTQAVIRPRGRAIRPTRRLVFVCMLGE